MNMIKNNAKAVLSPNPKKDTALVFAAKKSHGRLLYRVFAVRGFQLKKGVMEPTIFETTSARIDQPNYDNARRLTVEYYNNYTKALQPKSHRKLQVAVKVDPKAAKKAKEAGAKQNKAKKAAAKKAKKVAKEAAAKQNKAKKAVAKKAMKVAQEAAKKMQKVVAKKLKAQTKAKILKAAKA